jgi:hypothetical protein
MRDAEDCDTIVEGADAAADFCNGTGARLLSCEALDTLACALEL